MSETKWTPGPWTLLPEECGKDYIRIRGTVWGGRYKISNVITPTYDGVPDRELTETRANAHLIAAAPELYEALEYVIKQIPEFGTVPGIAEAMAKARGES